MLAVSDVVKLSLSQQIVSLSGRLDFLFSVTYLHFSSIGGIGICVALLPCCVVSAGYVTSFGRVCSEYFDTYIVVD